MNGSIDCYLHVMREKTCVSTSLSDEETIECLSSDETQQKVRDKSLVGNEINLHANCTMTTTNETF